MKRSASQRVNVTPTHHFFASARRSAFTLIELLVALGVISILLAILMPALRAGRCAADDLRCRADLRTIVMDFATFADSATAGSRGDSERLGGNRFRLEDFQEKQYNIDEFWDGALVERERIKMSEAVMMCPAGPKELERRSHIPCSSGAVGPQANVSLAFNRRLFKKTRYIDGMAFPANAYLTQNELNFPDAPLLFDVDGAVAVERGVPAYYSAPAVKTSGVPDIYVSGDYWFPSMRHGGRMNVGFIGGHVLSSSSPLEEPWWRWDHQPE
ncbi:MAG: type II secretion system protein [Phycisphaerae bacterium]